MKVFHYVQFFMDLFITLFTRVMMHHSHVLHEANHEVRN